jgi:hypothetical protein
MRGAVALACAVAAAQMIAHASAAVVPDRLEFSGLTSPCDEAAAEQELAIENMELVNDGLTDQIEALWLRINSELVTYGDTTNLCSSRCVLWCNAIRFHRQPSFPPSALALFGCVALPSARPPKLLGMLVRRCRLPFIHFHSSGSLCSHC